MKQVRPGKRVLALLLVMAGLPAVAQQNIQFSQYAFNGLSVNPAYAGYRGNWYLNSIYRHQWAGFPGAPRTGGISLDGVINTREDRLGVGVQLMFDKLGPQETLSGFLSYAYRIPLEQADTRRLCIGIAGGVSQYAINGNVLQYTDQLDEAIPVGKASVLVPDAHVGVYYYTPRFYAGLSVMDLFSLYTDNTRYYRDGYHYKTIRKTQHLYLTAGYLLTLSPQFKLKPTIMVKEDFKGPTNIDINALLLIAEKVWVGGSYRTGARLWNKSNLDKNLDPLDAASAIVEFYATPNLRIGYAYDMSVNQLAGYEQGSHEISIGYLFRNKRKQMEVLSTRYF